MKKEFARYNLNHLSPYEIRFKEVSGLLSYLSKVIRVKTDEEHQKVLRKYDKILNIIRITT